MKNHTRILATACVLALLALLACSYLTGCSSVAGIKSAWSSDNRAATAHQLEADAVSILGKVAVSELQALASSNGDYGHAAAGAAWSAVDLGTIAQVITDTGATPALAGAAESVARNAVANSGVSKATAIHAVASAISSGALK